MMGYESSKAWCPECGDELKNKSVNMQDEYYCIGCDETFVLVKMVNE